MFRSSFLLCILASIAGIIMGGILMSLGFNRESFGIGAIFIIFSIIGGVGIFLINSDVEIGKRMIIASFVVILISSYNLIQSSPTIVFFLGGMIIAATFLVSIIPIIRDDMFNA